MNPVLKIDTNGFKESIKRNAIGQGILATIVVGVVYFVTFNGYISLFVGLAIISVYLLLNIVMFYWTVVSVLLDKALFAVVSRATVNE